MIHRKIGVTIYFNFGKISMVRIKKIIKIPGYNYRRHLQQSVIIFMYKDVTKTLGLQAIRVFIPILWKFLYTNCTNFALGNYKPITLLSNSYGKELVVHELHAIDQGIFV